MKPMLIIKTGCTLATIPASRGDFEHWIVDALGPVQTTTVDVTAGETLPAHDAVSGAIVTGSAAMVTERLPWSELSADWLRQAVEVGLPVLGICYGHQLLAHALGGVVDFHPEGREIGTTDIQLCPEADDDPLFTGLPDSFPVHLTHRQSVLEPPPGAVRLALNAFDPYQALRFAPRAWGLQFHPEFAADVMLAYLAGREGDLVEEGFDVEALRLAVRDTPDATSLIRRFAGLVVAL